MAFGVADGARPRPVRPLYLHFLDRELVEAVGVAIDPDSLERYLAVLALGTDAVLYCGISVIWEHTLLDERSRQTLAMMVGAGAIRPISYNATVEEFFESRLALYKHDADRYPLYFQLGLDAIKSILPTDYKAERTTDQLQQSLGGWALGGAQFGTHSEDMARSAALRALTRRDTEAITFAYFAPFMRTGARNGTAESILNRQISYYYADHYLRYSSGDIATGISGLGFFDRKLSVDFPLQDIPLLRRLLQALGFGDVLGARMTHRSYDWQTLLAMRGFGVHGRVVSLIRLLLLVAYWHVLEVDGVLEEFGIRERVWGFVRPQFLAVQERPRRPEPMEARLEAAEAVLYAVVNRWARDPRLATHVQQGRLMFTDPGVDVLIVTATLVETQAVLAVLKSDYHFQEHPHFIGEKTYFDLGVIRGAKVYLMQTEMGSGGPSGSTLSIVDGISALDPSSVVMIGIAFGVDTENQSIGDVLVSRQVLSYDLQRVEGDSKRRRVVLRGDRVTASPRLLDRCRAAVVDWHHCPVHFGLVLSGDKLIDDLTFRDELVQLAGGEAVGGEMEGAGMYASAHRRKVDWILVKAICDWADGHKEHMLQERQQTAAVNAAIFFSHVLSKGGMVA